MTVEKKLEEFEERIRFFGSRLAEFANEKTEREELCKKFQGLEAFIDTFWNWRDSLTEQLYGLNEKIEALPKLVDLRFGIAMEKIAKVAENLAQVTKKCSEIEERIGPLSDKILDVDARAKELQSEEKDLQLIVGGLKVLISHNAEVSDQIKRDISAYNSLSISLREEIKSLRESIHSHDHFHMALSKEISSENTQLQNKIDTLHERIGREVFSLAATLTKRLDSIVIPDVSKFITHPDLDLLKHQIALATLDAKNSLTRSTNNDMQLQIIGKKVDGFQLHFRTQELATQG